MIMNLKWVFNTNAAQQTHAFPNPFTLPVLAAYFVSSLFSNLQCLFPASLSKRKQKQPEKTFRKLPYHLTTTHVCAQ